MKRFSFMIKNKEYDVYTFSGSKHWELFPVLKVLSYDFEPYQLINWLFDKEKESIGSKWISIDKEDDVIALYDVTDSMDETYTGEYLLPEKRFEMSFKNFEEILLRWEELRVSRPDMILVIIHKDNSVAIETDPVIMKEYQALIINKKSHNVH